MMIVLLFFLQKQKLANAIYLFGLGTLLSLTGGRARQSELAAEAETGEAELIAAPELLT